MAMEMEQGNGGSEQEIDSKYNFFGHRRQG